MNRSNRKASKVSDDHVEALGDLLTQLKTHLAQSAGKKGTYGDYIRLLDFYTQNNASSWPKQIIVGWIDDINSCADSEQPNV